MIPPKKKRVQPAIEQKSADVGMTLDGRRRTNVDGREEFGGPGSGFEKHDSDGTNKDSNWTICQLMENPGVCDSTDRAFVTGKPGVVGVDVIRLDKPDEGHEQHGEHG
jgi:hypothetical protein